MYQFDDKDKPPPSTLSFTIPNNRPDGNNDDHLYSSSYPSLSFHQPHSLDDNYSFLNWGNETHDSMPPSAFLSDMPSLGQGSFLAQDGIYVSSGDQQEPGPMFSPLTNNQQGNVDMFSSLTDQEQYAILMSEPNFLRQQTLLQQNKEDNVQQQDDSPMRSNLTAMFGQSSSSAKTPLINNKLRKETNRRSQPRGINRMNAIPINAGSKHSSAEIDHQRRFNELQARFRVNYARKPTTSSSLSTQQFDLSVDGNDFGLQNHTGAFGSSMPTYMEKSNRVFGDTENGIGHLGTKSSTTPVKGITIPKNNNSSSSSIKQAASSFPSRTMPIQIQRVHRTNINQPLDAEQHQKRLDDQLVKTNFDDITVSELKEMLRQRGKPATGKKAILLQRLVDERDIIHAVRSGKILHRHSQPPIISASSYDNNNTTTTTTTTSSQPYQGDTSPMYHHASSLDSPSSVPNTMFLSSSPGSVTLLNRSIADMHIGSPPIRRYSPYNAPGSPRASPKMQTQQQQAVYSSSMPNHSSLSSSLDDGYLNPNRNMRFYNQGLAGPKSYAPFTSSALATPDRDHDDPFDRMAREQGNVDQPIYTNGTDETMEWANNHGGDSSLNALLQDLPEGVSIDQFLAWLAENGDQFNMDPMKMDMDGMIPMDPGRPLYDDPSTQ
ncbi:hypothetical protein BC941DRAFT_424609 [Chlamydoabsidia padenii]|nr:hypothetical protein BC941DRAFT_424609 [Chlamydoabsidia padenii]